MVMRRSQILFVLRLIRFPLQVSPKASAPLARLALFGLGKAELELAEQVWLSCLCRYSTDNSECVKVSNFVRTLPLPLHRHHQMLLMLRKPQYL